jgi:hypothetical protein
MTMNNTMRLLAVCAVVPAVVALVSKALPSIDLSATWTPPPPTAAEAYGDAQMSRELDNVTDCDIAVKYSLLNPDSFDSAWEWQILEHPKSGRRTNRAGFQRRERLRGHGRAALHLPARRADQRDHRGTNRRWLRSRRGGPALAGTFAKPDAAYGGLVR